MGANPVERRRDAALILALAEHFDARLAHDRRLARRHDELRLPAVGGVAASVSFVTCDVVVAERFERDADLLVGVLVRGAQLGAARCRVSRNR